MIVRILRSIWTSPNTLLGLAIGTLSLCFGGRAQFRQGCVEYHGGLVTQFLKQCPPGGSTAAMTLGQSILGRDAASLDRYRQHEQVHVRQYERWGPFFLPVYLGWSLVLWLQRRDPYLENPFEVQAYAIADPRNSAASNDHQDES